MVLRRVIGIDTIHECACASILKLLLFPVRVISCLFLGVVD